EELKITGKWEIVENKKVLLPEMCSLYTFHKFYQKQALIRTFDCDHLKYSILENSNEWIVSPAMKSEAETENYFKWKYI
ncbi:MAG TPA: hypothetical protein PKZ66_04160, partial [Chitinophagaceae bacterium]|nr:hypothetical protein [Chitinophagaceae bacterium]